jgi:hypothetical protein
MKAFAKNLLLFTSLLTVQAIEGQTTESAWNYPAQPGTTEWSKLKTKKEKIDVCQIPDQKLAKMSTDTLIKTCFSHPLLPDIFFYDNLKVGFESKLSTFNGFKELLLRKDVGTSLIKFYKKMEPNLSNKPDLGDPNSTFKFVFVELLLAHPSLIVNLTENQKKEILKETLKKYNDKKENPEVYSILNRKTSLLIMHLYTTQEKSISPDLNPVNDNLTLFEKQVTYPGDSIANLIVEKTKKYINK